MKTFLTLFIITLIISCKPPCNTCKEDGKKYRSIKKAAKKLEKKMDREAKKGKK